MIDANFCNALLTHTTSATFSWQINAMRQTTLADRFADRAVAPDKALRGITLLIAELANLTFDTQIRCGTLPASTDTGYAVSLTGCDKRENFDATAWNVLFYGRGANAATLLGTAETLAAKLPLPLGVTIQDTELVPRIAVAQLTCGKMQLDNVGGKGSAPCTLKMELTAEVLSGI